MTIETMSKEDYLALRDFYNENGKDLGKAIRDLSLAEEVTR